MTWEVVRDPKAFPIRFCLMAGTGYREYYISNLLTLAIHKYGGLPVLLREGNRWRVGSADSWGVGQSCPAYSSLCSGSAWDVAVWVAEQVNIMRTRNGVYTNAWVLPYDYREDAPCGEK